MEISGAGRKGRKYKFWSKVGQLEQFEQQLRAQRGCQALKKYEGEGCSGHVGEDSLMNRTPWTAVRTKDISDGAPLR